MSDGGRERAPLGLEMWKSSQKWSVQRSAVRSIAWLDPSCIDVAKTVVFPLAAPSCDGDPALSMWLLKQPHLIVVYHMNHANSEMPGRTPLSGKIGARRDSLANVHLGYGGFRARHRNVSDARSGAARKYRGH
ncbi:MAG: hypothetical protein ABIT38_22855 [Gemmatimonadaceae bacterium]